MKRDHADVDIDCFQREKILEKLPCAYGRIDRGGKFEKHNTGVYFQAIPRDPISNISTLDYRIANDYGYFKVDFLNVNFYEYVRNEAHLKELIDREPPWDFFTFPEITDKLFQLHGHSRLLQFYKPKSVIDLAVILAIIRPSKAYLQMRPWGEVLEKVWVKDSSEYQYKRSHAVSYALAIVVHLNLIVERMMKEMA